MRIALFIIPCAALGILLAVMAAGVKKGTNIFKIPAVAWMITGVMVVVAIGIGLEKAERPPVNQPAPPPNAIPATPVEDYVRDDAGVLSSRTEQTLNERNIRLMDNYEVLIGVATCNYGGDDLYDYALQCAEDMGLGGYDFTVVLDISGENYWLVQGDKLTRDFTDGDCSDYAYNYMEASFAKGDYDKAVLSLTEALENWYEDYYG